jgi:Na+/proline symporter
MPILRFTPLDWSILVGYGLLLALAGYASTRRGMQSADDYFLASHRAPTWLVAVSVLSTVQSTATFLGVPDNSFRGNYTYLTNTLGALLGAWLVASVLMPRFYAMNASTVYELLEVRFSRTARRTAGAMYLVGRILASGSRLYLAAIAVSMILFLDVTPEHIVIASFALLVFGLAFTFMGGLNSVIWSDLVQVVLYVGAAVVVVIFLLGRIPVPIGEIFSALAHPPEGGSKLQVLDWSLSLSQPFSVIAAVTGIMLINAANSGLDQDTTQRLLACDSEKQGSRALYWSVFASMPVIMLFLFIGSLLYIFYERPDLMTVPGQIAPSFQGEKITVFMSFILSEIPPGVRGFVTVGVIAAAAINSGLISMASVAINDFYRPFVERKGRRSERHFVIAGRVATVVLGFSLFLMSFICYYWQRYSDVPLLEFVLGVMTFAYSGLIGVYVTAVFTKRGSTASVIAALAAGFVVVLLFQPIIIDILGLPTQMKAIAFPWHLCIGATAATLVCLAGNARPAIEGQPNGRH